MFFLKRGRCTLAAGVAECVDQLRDQDIEAVILDLQSSWPC